MESSDEGTPAKPSKPTSSQTSSQEAPAIPSYPEWANHMQAYYGAGATPPFFASAVASPTPHPYMWGGQHPLMPPYGTPIPYPALYHPGGVYAHPNMAMAPSTSQVNVESDAKASEGKGNTSGKKSKGSSSGKKTASSSGNDGGTQSTESGSDGSSDANDENNSQEFPASKKGSFDHMLANGNPAISLPATNLNIGMDLWNIPSAGPGSSKLQPNPARVSPAGREGMMPDQWIQDERELKRQKRKQSNRESARRSRLRKQAECEELQHRVEALSEENRLLADELQRLSEECAKLTSENESIKEELNSLYGPQGIPRPDCNGFADHNQERDDDGSSGE